jgi:hypothetical protein
VRFKPYKTFYSRLLALLLPGPHDKNRGKRKGTADDGGPRKMVTGQRQEDVDLSAENGQGMILTDQIQQNS